LSDVLNCPRCGSKEIQLVAKIPNPPKQMEYTYKCLVCNHVWKVNKKL